MKDAEHLFESVVPKLEALIKPNSVIGKVMSVGERHALPLVEVSLSFGGGGGGGSGADAKTGVASQGTAAGAGGGAKVTPVAVLIIEGQTVRLSPLGH